MSRSPRKSKVPKPPKPLPPWEAALELARKDVSGWRLGIETVEGPELADLLAAHPIVLGVHPLLSKPNIGRVLNTRAVRKALVVTDVETSSTLAVALDVWGIMMPSGIKRKDAAKTDWLVCLPPAPEPWTEPQLVRLLTPLPISLQDEDETDPPRPKPPSIDDLPALAILGRTAPPDPRDEADLAALAP